MAHGWGLPTQIAMTRVFAISSGPNHLDVMKCSELTAAVLNCAFVCSEERRNAKNDGSKNGVVLWFR